MNKKIDLIPHWAVKIDEVSPGVYRLRAKHELGLSIDLTGFDSEKLLEQAKESAAKMEHELKTQNRSMTASPTLLSERLSD